MASRAEQGSVADKASQKRTAARARGCLGAFAREVAGLVAVVADARVAAAAGTATLRAVARHVAYARERVRRCGRTRRRRRPRRGAPQPQAARTRLAAVVAGARAGATDVAAVTVAAVAVAHGF